MKIPKITSELKAAHKKIMAKALAAAAKVIREKYAMRTASTSMSLDEMLALMKRHDERMAAERAAFIANPPPLEAVVTRLKVLREYFSYWAQQNLPPMESPPKDYPPHGRCSRMFVANISSVLLHLETGETEVASDEVADLLAGKRYGCEKERIGC